MTDRERHLPKWAQTELTNLRRTNRRLVEALEQAGPPDSDTFVGDYGAYGATPRQALGRGAKISLYTTADTDDWDTRVDVRVENGWVKVYGGRSLVVKPESSNTLRLRSE